jgi:Flp pilus assembly protein CpaB
MEVVDRIPTNKDALPADLRKQRLHELAAKESTCLYEMGTLVRQAIESGTPVPISKLLEPTHVLGVRVRPRLEAVA